MTSSGRKGEHICLQPLLSLGISCAGGSSGVTDPRVHHVHPGLLGAARMGLGGHKALWEHEAHAACCAETCCPRRQRLLLRSAGCLMGLIVP